MGFFKDIKTQINSAERSAAAAPQAQANAQAQVEALQAGLTPGTWDPNDPAFQPIEGVSLERYAQLVSLVSKQNLPDEAGVDAFMVQQGLAAGQWKTVNDGWVKRMGTNRAVTNRYGQLYMQASTGA